MAKSVSKEVPSKLALTSPEGSELYFDIFFTSLMLTKKIIKASGTLRPNRMGACDLDTKEMTKRGDFQCFIIMLLQTKCISAWKDNKVVCVLSNFCGMETKKIKAEKQKGDSIMIEVPDSVSTSRNTEAMVVNAWILYNGGHHDYISNFEFRRYDVKCLLSTPTSLKPKNPGRKSMTA